MTSTSSAQPRPGDSIEAFFSDPDDINPRPELLCASMTVRDQTFKYYRFQTPNDGVLDDHDQDGRSTRKFLVRTPILDAKFRISASATGFIRSSALYASAHRRRLGGPDRHADFRRGQWRDHPGRFPGFPPWPPHRDRARQRLCHDL